MDKTGNLCEIREVKFEWEIKDFFLLSKKSEIFYVSPQFDFCGASWEIRIFPNGQQGSEGWISLFLARMSSDIPVTVDYSFSLKTVNGNIDSHYTGSHVFVKNNSGWGFFKFIPRSALIRRKPKLLPSGILTVILTMMNGEKNEADGIGDSKKTCVDVFTQTSEGIGIGDSKKTCVDVFTQTSEGIGNEDSKKTCVDTVAQTIEGTGVWKLQHHLKKILLNGNVSDVVLKVDDQELKCHRCILAARSPVFLGMLTHEMKEKNTGVVNIPDADPNTFSDFLNYLYTGSRENVTSLNVVKLYAAADKYQVDDLKEVCLDCMLKNITVDNFCDFLTLSLKYGEKVLTDACSQYYLDNTLDISLTSKWQVFLSENPIAGNELHIKYIKQAQLNK